MDPPSFESLEVKAPGANGVGQLVLNRPTKSNAIDRGMWSSLQARWGVATVQLGRGQSAGAAMLTNLSSLAASTSLSV